MWHETLSLEIGDTSGPWRLQLEVREKEFMTKKVILFTFKDLSVLGIGDREV